ncbi:MAG TPA: carboxypeptidase regulatory-like domain-containing protein [Polyangia bacterium]|jgi:plastocyanin
MIKRAVAVFAVAASVATGACQKESAPHPAPAAAPSATPASAAPAPTGHGVIEGAVKLNGTPPEMAPTKRDADPFCAKTPMKEEEVVVGPGGGLGNVVVRVTEGASGRYDPPAAPATLDQSACMYRPRVQAIVAGQMVSIRNGDQTLHNVHGYKGPSTLFNQAEIPGLAPIVRRIGDAGDILKFKCDVHPWMTGYVLVNSNPYFAVTGPDGKFKIAGLPPGKYTLTAWQERYGAKTATVTVAEDKPAEVSFAYDAK